MQVNYLSYCSDSGDKSFKLLFLVKIKIKIELKIYIFGDIDTFVINKEIYKFFAEFLS